LVQVKLHKYQTTGYSWLDNQLNPFWTKCADVLPYSFSPNLVTLSGVLAQVSALLLILYYDSTMSKTLPTWLYFYFVFVIFVGQTTDAIDGKHARNTNRSSPLGQIMDHGCDAFSNSFIIIMCAQAHRYGPTVYTSIIQILVQINFFFFNWDENNNGIMMTNINNFGITEFQFLAVGIILFPTILGQEFFSTKIFLNSTPSEFVVYINLYVGVMSCITLFKKNIKNWDDFVNKAYPIASLFLVIFAELLSVKLQLFKEYTFYIVLVNALFFANMTTKLIVCTMTHKKIEKFNWETLIYLILIIISVLTGNLMIEVFLISLCTLWITVKYTTYMISIMRQLMKELKIPF